jgi:hypothetical protein
MKTRYILLLGGLLMSAVAPHMSLAATHVSRQFDADFFYFPQTVGAVVFSNGSFFESDDPTTIHSWSTTAIHHSAIDAFRHYGAVKLKHHVYAIGGHIQTTAQDIGLLPDRIVRMKADQPDSMKSVKRVPITVDGNANELVDLIKFKGDLLAIDFSHALFRSHDGTHWHEVNTSDLPNGTIRQLVSGEDTIYAVYDSAIYTSTDGKTWTVLTGPYQNHVNNGGLSVAEFNGKTYVASYSHEDENAFVWQAGNRANFTELFTKSNDVNYSLVTANDTLYLTGSDGTIRTLQGDQFQLVDEVNGVVQGVVVSNDTTLFIVNKSGQFSLWK